MVFHRFDCGIYTEKEIGTKYRLQIFLINKNKRGESTLVNSDDETQIISTNSKTNEPNMSRCDLVNIDPMVSPSMV